MSARNSRRASTRGSPTNNLACRGVLQPGQARAIDRCGKDFHVLEGSAAGFLVAIEETNAIKLRVDSPALSDELSHQFGRRQRLAAHDGYQWKLDVAIVGAADEFCANEFVRA